MVMNMKRIAITATFLFGLLIGPAFADFGNSQALISSDINSAGQVIGSHLSSALPIAQGGTANSSGWIKGTQGVLGSLRSANFNTTADQAIALNSAITAWVPTGIWVTNCSATVLGAVGGVYTATSKGGTAIVAAGQAYAGLTSTSVILPMTIATGLTTRFAISTVYLSLTAALGSAATCDVYVIGIDLT